ncbi:hypothetical protein EI42_04749 [Thermosporothrix hazakensis]|uniref:Uncharacterized protein n=1 Tax=Thermosporothrix hazakensis TaxID=644383 RepID=A0A326U0T9_THEHA|nr:hypothetical protein EI42_04749 [Thermosporothrix hazakensis]
MQMYELICRFWLFTIHSRPARSMIRTVESYFVLDGCRDVLAVPSAGMACLLC